MSFVSGIEQGSAEILVGKVDHEVDQRRFALRADDYQTGAQRANVHLAAPLLHAHDDEPLHYTGWACGIYTLKNLLLMYGQDVSMTKIEEVARTFGATEEWGVDERTFQHLETYFGLRGTSTSVFLAKELSSRRPVVWVASIWQMDWDRLISNQEGDGHWVVMVPGQSNFLVIDSSLRGFRDGGDTYGCYTLTPSGLARACYDCDEEIDPTGTKVRAGATWYQGEVRQIEQLPSWPVML